MIASPSGVERFFEQCAELLPGPSQSQTRSDVQHFCRTVKDTAETGLTGCTQTQD